MSKRLFHIFTLAALAGAVTIGPARATTDPCPTSNAPNELELVGGSLQTAKLGQQFPGLFQVALANSNHCPLTGSLAGTAIEFAAPGSGASGLFATTGTASAVVGTDAN